MAQKEYISYSEKYGELAEGFRAIQSVLGWNTIYDAEKNRVITPLSRSWNEAWQKHGAVFENINSAKGVANRKDQLNCAPYYHWGALMGIMKFIEEGSY